MNKIIMALMLSIYSSIGFSSSKFIEGEYKVKEIKNCFKTRNVLLGLVYKDGDYLNVTFKKCSSNSVRGLLSFEQYDHNERVVVLDEACRKESTDEYVKKSKATLTDKELLFASKAHYYATCPVGFPDGVEIPCVKKWDHQWNFKKVDEKKIIYSYRDEDKTGQCLLERI